MMADLLDKILSETIEDSFETKEPKDMLELLLLEEEKQFQESLLMSHPDFFLNKDEVEGIHRLMDEQGVPLRTAENIYYREKLTESLRKTISNLPSLDPEKTFPIKEPPEGIIEKTKKAWEFGILSNDINHVWTRAAEGKISNEEALEVERKYRKYLMQNPLGARNWAENIWLKTTSMSVPMLEGTYKGAKLGTITGGMALAAGQVGPQLFTPEELITAPIASIMGFVGGSLKYWADQGRGEIYKNLILEGVNSETAAYAAAIGGPLYGAVELAQVRGLAPRPSFLKKGILRSSLYLAMKVARETSEEGAQRIITDSSETIAKLLDDKIELSDIPEEMKQTLWNSLIEMKEALGPMVLLVGGGEMVGTTTSYAEAKVYNERTIIDEIVEERVEATGQEKEQVRATVEKEYLGRTYVPEKGELEEMREPAEIPPITEAVPLPTETKQAIEDELTREFAERMGVPENIARQEVRRAMAEAKERAAEAAPAEAAPAIEAEERTKLEEELKNLKKEREKTLKLIAESEELGAPPALVEPTKRALAETEQRINEIEQQLQAAERAVPIKAEAARPKVEEAPAEVKPVAEKLPENIYMKMPMERVIVDAKHGITLAREALMEREPERALRMGIEISTEKQKQQFKEHIKNPKARPGFVLVPQVPETLKQTAAKADKFASDVKDELISYRFYPKAPPEFRNAVRKDLIGAANKARQNVFEYASNIIWGGMKENDIKQSVELIFARDQYSRTKLGKGNPNISLEQAKEILDEVEERVSEEAKQSVDRWREIKGAYTEKLVERGVLEEDQLIEDHVRHYVEDYTPEWAPAFGIPTRLKRPFRGYAKKAVGTTKKYRQDQDALLASLMEMEYHNLVEDFVETQIAKYDIKPSLTKEQRAELFGIDKRGHALPGKPGRIYIIDGKRYRGYSPDMPFSRTLFPTEDGLIALGGYKNVSVIPEEIYNTFRDFSERGSRPIYWMNRITNFWKSIAILSHYPSFNINNLIGDTWFAFTQHPKPMKLISEIETALTYLTGKGEGEYFKRLDDFVKEHDIKWTFIHSELGNIKRSGNPLGYLIEKSYQFSDFRESILRVAYASSLLREMEAGNGAKMVKAHDWIDTTNLNTEDALGKISREVQVDYEAVSKPFRRHVRGGIAPFGTFYFKATERTWKWFYKHPIKGTAAFMALPLASVLYNNRDDEAREIEEKLPDYVRNRIHFNLGEGKYKNTYRVISLQLPQDVLIGTKIFSIATDYASRAIRGEMEPEEAVIAMFKRWGVAEVKGIAYLMSPWIRYIKGYMSDERRDPYDNAPIYRRDVRTLTLSEKLIDESIYFLKCSVPILAASLQTYEKGLPQDIALKKYLDTFAGKGAFGIYDINPSGEIVIERNGKKYTFNWDDAAKITAIERQELKHLGRIEDAFVASGMMPKDFAKGDKIRKELLKLFDYYSQFVPDIKDKYSEDDRVDFVALMLGDRLINSVISPTTLQKWYQVRLERAETKEEENEIAEQYQKLKEKKLIEFIKTKPKSARQLEIISKFNEVDLPWYIMWDIN